GRARPRRRDLRLHGHLHPRGAPGRCAPRRPPARPARAQTTDHGRIEMTYIAEVDADECAAHGDCADVAPEVFAIDDVARVIGTGPDELLLAAAEACPSVALRIIDRESGEQVYP